MKRVSVAKVGKGPGVKAEATKVLPTALRQAAREQLTLSRVAGAKGRWQEHKSRWDGGREADTKMLSQGYSKSGASPGTYLFRLAGPWARQ